MTAHRDELGVVCTHGQLERVCQLCELTAERDALAELVRECVKHLELIDRGTTHYDGCEADHYRCALRARARAAIGEGKP